MAVNSKRELLLAKIKTILDNDVSALAYVERKPLQGLSALQEYPQTQLPLAVVLGGMPVPVEKPSDRDIALDRVLSTLAVSIMVYALDNETPDTTISTLADDIWAALYDDMTLGYAWVLNIRILPDADVAFWEPYAAFSMQVEITYLHGKGGI